MLTEKIALMMNDEARYLKHSSDNIERSALYSWKNTAQKMLAVLKSLE